MMVDILKRPFNFFDNKVIGKKLLVKNLISLDAIGKELDTLTVGLPLIWWLIRFISSDFRVDMNKHLNINIMKHDIA